MKKKFKNYQTKDKSIFLKKKLKKIELLETKELINLYYQK